MDLGTGDGRAPLHVARTRSDMFAFGVEPALDALKDTARWLARRPLPNIALLIGTAADAATLGPIADEVTVAFPWGPLLDAALGDGRGLADVAALLRPGASLRVLVSVTERERRLMPSDVQLEDAYAACGLDVVCVRPATRGDVAASRSTWGKRLGAGRTRPATLIEARKTEPTRLR